MKTRLFLMTILIMITISSCGSSYNYPEEVEKEVMDSTYQFPPMTFSDRKLVKSIPECIYFFDAEPEVIIYSNLNGSPYVGYMTNLKIKDGYYLCSEIKTDWYLSSTFNKINRYVYRFIFLVKEKGSRLCYRITMNVHYKVLYSEHRMKGYLIDFDSVIYPFDMIDKF